MRHMILVAVILQLMLTVDINGYEFGDIVLFPRCMKGHTYAHFGVYVGNKAISSKTDAKHDLFERLKATPPKCIFSKLPGTPEVTNYLDGYKDKDGKVYKAGTEAEMISRIDEKFKKCGLYLIAHNNCEHLATYVRYGVKVALQFNTDGEGLCTNDPKIDKAHLLQYLRDQMTSSTCVAESADNADAADAADVAG